MMGPLGPDIVQMLSRNTSKNYMKATKVQEAVVLDRPAIFTSSIPFSLSISYTNIGSKSSYISTSLFLIPFSWLYALIHTVACCWSSFLASSSRSSSSIGILINASNSGTLTDSMPGTISSLTSSPYPMAHLNPPLCNLLGPSTTSSTTATPFGIHMHCRNHGKLTGTCYEPASACADQWHQWFRPKGTC